jgi:hypothetical protein
MKMVISIIVVLIIAMASGDQKPVGTKTQNTVGPGWYAYTNAEYSLSFHYPPTLLLRQLNPIESILKSARYDGRI